MKSLQANDFELFGLPQQFALDRGQLDDTWKALQREAHPDRFAPEGAAAQRVAMQWSVRINEAYQRLKDPLKRAAYLCELRGVPVQAESNKAMPPAFLMQQMEWREALDDAEGAAALQVLADRIAEIFGRQIAEAIDDLLHDGVLERRRLVGQTHPDIAQPLPDRDLAQAVFDAVDVGHLGQVRRRDELAVEIVAQQAVAAEKAEHALAVARRSRDAVVRPAVGRQPARRGLRRRRHQGPAG